MLSLCAGALIACGNTSNAQNGAAAGSSALGGVSGGGASNGGAANGGASGLGAATSGSGGAAEPDPSNVVAACVYYARHYCERIAQCQGRAGSCDAAGDLCPDLLLSEGSTGTLAGFVSCAKEWDQVSCQSLALGLQPECITPGTKLVGEACLFPSQCSTLSCTGDGRTCGACQAVGAGGVGSACSDTLGCPGFLSCTAGVCVPSVVVAAEAGEPCPNSLCMLGARCKDSICTPLPTEGQSCPDDVCASDLYCTTRSVCEKYPTLNEDCETAKRCADSRCDYGPQVRLVCLAWPGEGMPCDRACTPGNRCAMTVDSGVGLCVAVHDRGGSCNGTIDCLDGLTCNQPDAKKPGTCAVYGLPGDPCDGTTTVCRPGAVCDSTQCKPVDSLGLFKNACQLGATN